MNKLIVAALALASLATPAGAVTRDPSVQALEVAAKISPSDGGAAVELANAYWRTGRTAEAYDTYRRALALNNVMLETKLGDAIWSHEVARRALAHQVRLTAR